MSYPSDTLARRSWGGPACCALWAAVLLAGCGQGPAAGGDASQPRNEAGVPSDAGGDAGSDAAVETDAAADATGGMEAGVGAGAGTCSLVDDEPPLELAASHQARPLIATAAIGDHVHVLYAAAACQQGSREGQGLRALRVPSTGSIPDPVDVVNVDPSARCVQTRAPSLAAEGADRARAFYAAANSGSLELYAQTLATEALDGSPGTRLSFDDPDARRDESLTAVITLRGHHVLAFTREELASDRRGVFTLRPELGVDAVASLSALSTDSRPLALAAVRLPGGDERAGVVVWADGGPEREGIHLQPVSGAGAAVGTAHRVEASIATEVALDAAAYEEGTAVVYTVGDAASQVRLLNLDAQGRPTRAPVRITGGNESARHASIAAFAAGYVIAFRSLTGNGTDGPTVRLAFVDAQGVLAGFRNVTAASSSGGQVQVEVTSDGRIVLVWPEVLPEGNVVRVARVECE